MGALLPRAVFLSISTELPVVSDVVQGCGGS